MPVPAKRFKLLDIDYNVPITDFLSEVEDSPLSDPVTNTVEAFNEALQNAIENGIVGTPGENDRLIITRDIIQQQDMLLRDLPDTYSQLEDPERITALFLSTVTGDINITNLLNTETARSLYDNIVEAYNILNRYGGNADIEFTDVLESVNKLDNYFSQYLDDPVATGSAYLAILNRLHYAGYTEAFSRLYSYIPEDISPYVAAGLIVTAANRHTPETIIDIANTPVASRIRYIAPNLISSIARTVRLNTIWDDETILQLEPALTAIEPSWVTRVRSESEDTQAAMRDAMAYVLGTSSLSDTPKNIPQLDIVVL